MTMRARQEGSVTRTKVQASAHERVVPYGRITLAMTPQCANASPRFHCPHARGAIHACCDDSIAAMGEYRTTRAVSLHYVNGAHTYAGQHTPKVLCI